MKRLFPKMAVAAGLVLALLVAGCQQHPDQQAEFYVFGTLVVIQVRGVEQGRAQQAFIEVNEELRRLHRDWHAWEPGALVKVNQALAAGESVPVNAELANLLQRCSALEQASLGYFNPTIGQLIALWGFQTSDFPITDPPPGDNDINQWLAGKPSADDLQIIEGTLRSRNPAVQIDLGGIAKGHAVDMIMALLERHGIENALINAGGDVRARGTQERPWRVGIQDPHTGMLGQLNIRADEAVFTSGTYHRYLQQDGLRYAHILNPKTGRSAQGLLAATVITPDAELADAAATALVAAGKDHWQEVADSMGIREYLLMTEEGELLMSRAMRDRLSLLTDKYPSTVVSAREVSG